VDYAQGAQARAKKALSGVVKNRDVFAEASREGLTASPERAFFDRDCASARATFVNNPR
jgi:hypothetical protein